MLLRQKNSSEVLCRKLELNIDNTDPTKYYVCYDFLCDKYMSRQHKSAYFGYSNNPNWSYGKLMNMETFLSNKKAVDNAGVDGVFVKGIVFMVTDDLQIMPIGTETCFTHLKSLDIKGRDLLDEHVVHVGVDEIVCMLRNSFLSKMPLTEVLLSNHASETPPALKFMSNNITESKAKCKGTANAETTNIVLKLTISKEKNKIMYAEAGKGFVAFLFSLLAFPLGSVVKLLGQTPSLGCLSNLYKTVEGPNLTEHMRTDRKASLLQCNTKNMTGVDPTHVHLVSSYRCQQLPDDLAVIPLFLILPVLSRQRKYPHGRHRSTGREHWPSEGMVATKGRANHFQIFVQQDWEQRTTADM
ncbi:hypothetical protein GIB67_015438 [Kingdonia uniflora]|uniref:Uncharacterized protein n=1 Tax=Kingdonia uniflora TaxID=39325 RepID=A0A7J7KYY3_9MAGN|nr:hypothetical protein GIB67_015438 [Kingdonia uniflora]